MQLCISVSFNQLDYVNEMEYAHELIVNKDVFTCQVDQSYHNRRVGIGIIF